MFAGLQNILQNYRTSLEHIVLSFAKKFFRIWHLFVALSHKKFVLCYMYSLHMLLAMQPAFNK